MKKIPITTERIQAFCKEKGIVWLDKEYKGNNRVTHSFLCPICNSNWNISIEQLLYYNNKCCYKCAHNHINYDDYIGWTINGCQIVSLSDNRKIYKNRISVPIYNTICMTCKKEQTRSCYNVCMKGQGCCTQPGYYEVVDNGNQLFTRLHNVHLKHSKLKNGGTSIDFIDYIKMIKMPCEFPKCNSQAPYEIQDGLIKKVQVNGIDRIDNKDGYIKENCGILCWGHNKIKGSFDKEALISLIPNFKEYFDKIRSYK